ncbi:hypothetical protein [Flavobacterium hibisci]|uniref:hypothetical protein n=1 Tax=Flavobacterium hibisci TaxID=1914462 RepID=UPI001CBAE2AB|nr:hypothetical protein [Flavobacterium hibisci]MBZ4042593.1 hypothetical protein [Flavobacterium hibisci]
MDLNKQKEYVENRNNLFALNDEDLIMKIIEDKLYISVIFEKYKDDFQKKLRSKSPKMDHTIIQDIFTESICVLYGKILKHGLRLLQKKGSSIAGYLMGICLNTIRNEIERHGNLFVKKDFENQNYDDYYIDSDEIQFQNIDKEFIIEQELLYKQTLIQYKVLEIMKNKGGKCYSLILLSFSPEYNYRIRNLTELFNYKNDHTTKSQKNKCMERLRNLYNNFQLA